MNDVMLTEAVDSLREIACAAERLRELVQQKDISPQKILEIFERWAVALDARELRNVPGVVFLRLWLRRGTLEPILLRELGPDYLNAGWQEDAHARLRAVPLG